MNQSLRLPLPPRETLDLVQRLLAERGERWRRRANRHAVRWEPELGPRASLPASILLTPGEHASSQLALIALDDRPLPPAAATFLSELRDRADQRLAARRSRIYRTVATDRRQPPARRLHAARVLGESDAARAADVLAELALHHADEPFGQEALAALATLGPAARNALWWLDATVTDGPAALRVARALVEVGDAPTAAFRLELLARHPDDALREAALHDLSALGDAALLRMTSLAQRGPAGTRLGALRWLAAQGQASAEMAAALGELASPPHAAEHRLEAVELLGEMGNDAAREQLRALLAHEPGRESRLAIAGQLQRAGDTGAARRVLLDLAQGMDDEAADTALDLLTRDEGGTSDEAAELMARGTLRRVRRRAAEALSQPQQPLDVQERAARVLLELDYVGLARPVLAHLAAEGRDLDRKRWAAATLATLGPRAADEMAALLARTDDPVVGQHLAEGLLAAGRSAAESRQAALWLAAHSNLPRAVEVLGELALSARVSGSDAVLATNDLAHFAATWAGAGRLLAALATESPHPAVRTRALDLLLREHPAEMPLALLVDLAITGSLGPADRAPVVQQLRALAQPAATRIVARIAAADDTDKRARLLQVMNELPDRAVTPALMRLSAGRGPARLRYIAAQQLITRGQLRVGYAALAGIALNATEPWLRESALYELGLALPRTEPLLLSILERTDDEGLHALARQMLRSQRVSLAAALVERWERWVASLPLGWLDRLVGGR